MAPTMSTVTTTTAMMTTSPVTVHRIVHDVAQVWAPARLGSHPTSQSVVCLTM